MNEPKPEPYVAQLKDRLAAKKMRHKTYPGIPGQFWKPYPESLADEWVWPARTVEDLPPDWNNFRPRSERLDEKLGYKPLSDVEKTAIRDSATSREHFHDIDKICGKPLYGHCLCEVRIISGIDCIEHLSKDADGPHGKTPETGQYHWAWYVDIAPRGKVCPMARAGTYHGLPFVFIENCDILIEGKPPTSAWVLEQDPDDKKGTVAGRASTDILLEGDCPRCQVARGNKYFKIKDNNHMEFNQGEKWFTEIYEEPEEDWNKKCIVQPSQYMPQNGIPHHPTLRVEGFYHLSTLDMYDVGLEHIIHPGYEEKTTWQEHYDKMSTAMQNAREAERKEAQLASEQFAQLMKYDEEKKAAAKMAEAADTQQWH